MLTFRGDSYRLRAKRKSGLIKPPTGRPPTESLKPEGWGQFSLTQRGQFRMAFDKSAGRGTILVRALEVYVRMMCAQTHFMVEDRPCLNLSILLVSPVGIEPTTT
jgi:hypothetical protein